MVYLRRLKIRNFFSFKGPVELSFPFKGLLVFVGDNGAGKTSITTDALSYALFGRTLRYGTEVSACANIYSKGQGYIELELQSGKDKVYSIVRAFRPSSFAVACNGRQLKMKASELPEHLGLDWQTFTHSAILCFSSQFLTEAAPAVRARIYQGMLGLEPMFELLWERAKRLTADILADINQLSYEKEYAQGQADVYRKQYDEIQCSIESLLIQAANVSEDRNRLDRFHREYGELADIIAKLNKRREEIAKEREGLNSEYHRIVSLPHSISSLSEKLSRARAELDSLMRSVCPFCNRPWRSKQKEVEVEHQIAKLSSQLDVLRADEVKGKKVVRRCAYLEKQSRELGESREKLEKRFLELEEQIRRLDEFLSSVPTQADVGRAKLSAATIKGDLDKLEKEIQLKVAKLERLEMAHACGDAWSLLLSPKGELRYSSLVSTIPHFKKILSHYLRYLFPTVSCDIRLERRSQDLLDMALELGGGQAASDFRGMSAGERQRVNLAFYLTCARLIAGRSQSPLGFVVFDDAHYALDACGLQAIWSLLANEARERLVLLCLTDQELAKSLPAVQCFVVGKGENGSFVTL
jgi:DNA repair exonuclease SbcCD ATPase subunit